MISRKYITQTIYINLEVKCENCGLDYCFDEELVSTCENGFHCPNCGEIVKEHENEINKKQKTCPYCKGHKKFAVMDGYFICQIIGNKLKFELGDIADSYEVEPFELPLGFCFACGSKLKRE